MGQGGNTDYIPSRTKDYQTNSKTAKGVTPICSDLFDLPVLFRFVPICAPCFREYPDLFRFAPLSADLFRFVFRSHPDKSEKIRETPFRRPLLKMPDYGV